MESFKTYILSESKPQERWKVHFKGKHGKPVVSAKSSYHAYIKADKIARKNSVGEPILDRVEKLT